MAVHIGQIFRSATLIYRQITESKDWMKPVNISSLKARKFQAGRQSFTIFLCCTQKVEEAAEHVWPLGKDSKTSPHFMEGSHFSKDQSQCLKV